MSGLLICAAVVATASAVFFKTAGYALAIDQTGAWVVAQLIGLALIAVALWLAYAAGGA